MIEKGTTLSQDLGDKAPASLTPNPSPSPPVGDTKDSKLQEPTTSSTDEDQATLTEPEAGASRPKAFQRIAFLIAWAPKRLRYDPENPPAFGYWLNLLYAISSTVTVANLYYNQPILNKMAETFDVSFERASSVATLMQAGYAGGLLFICPLGDTVQRRPFIIGLVFLTAMLWLGLCLTSDFHVFSALSFLTGFTTISPQLFLPLVGDIAAPARKGTSLAIIVSGLMLGMLVARLLSGIVANFTDWRNIYWLSFGAQNLLAILLWSYMPDYPSKNPEGINYFRVMWSIVKLLFTEPLLVQACVIAFLCSAVFTSFWTTLSFLLSSPPYELDSLIIGLFSLIGLVGIIGGPMYGKYVVDRVVPLVSSLLGQTCTMTGVLVGTFTGTHTVAGPAIQAVLADTGIQMTQISNRAAIYTINPKATNRINTAYMVAAFCGQLTGTAVGNRLYAQGGWLYSGGASIAFIGLSFIAAIARGPNETGWFGWSGGWQVKKSNLKR
ncbi:membrane protein [Plectosphaerella plurivora]|uniref:Membrane protein n=1 Tax=Plectosphaerella plurivora TaxID=936078 RepID=A0A9P9AGB7_9PEZI|nr:membrane protein [Plectosphaerella plurivora]